jgi:hypothetical protein
LIFFTTDFYSFVGMIRHKRTCPYPRVIASPFGQSNPPILNRLLRRPLGRDSSQRYYKKTVGAYCNTPLPRNSDLSTLTQIYSSSGTAP